MEFKLVLPLLVLAIAGIATLGKGITGFATSETCCEGPDCTQDNHCPKYPNLTNEAFTYLGSILLLIAAFGYSILKKNQH